MPTPNDAIQESAIELQVLLDRSTVAVQRSILKQLSELESSLISQLATTNVATLGRRALNKKIKDLQILIDIAYAKINETVAKNLREQADIAQTATEDNINDALIALLLLSLAVKIDITAKAKLSLDVFMINFRFDGLRPEQLWQHEADLFKLDLERALRGVRGDIAIAGADDATAVTELARRVKGTRAAAFKDGIIAKRKLATKRLIDTLANASAQQVAMDVYEKNDTLLKGYQHISVRDSKTSAICIARDRLLWTVKKQPVGHARRFRIPPLHFYCRSIVIPVFKKWGDIDNEKITDAINDHAKKNPDLASQLDRQVDLVRNSLNGRAAKDISYNEWLKGKPEDFQKELLGAGKWELWRQGKLTPKQLTDNFDRPITIEELRKRANRRD